MGNKIPKARTAPGAAYPIVAIGAIILGKIEFDDRTPNTQIKAAATVNIAAKRPTQIDVHVARKNVAFVHKSST